MRLQAARAQSCPAVLIDVITKAQRLLLLAGEDLDDGERVDIFRRHIRNLACRFRRPLRCGLDALRIAQSNHEQRGHNCQRNDSIRRAKE